jgi:hypothetical protein
MAQLINNYIIPTLTNIEYQRIVYGNLLNPPNIASYGFKPCLYKQKLENSECVGGELNWRDTGGKLNDLDWNCSVFNTLEYIDRLTYIENSELFMVVLPKFIGVKDF